MTAGSASPPPEQPPSPSNTNATTPTNYTAEHELKTANHVYLLDPVLSWIPAQVVSRNNEQEAVLSIPQYANEQAIVCDGGRSAQRTTKQTVNLANYDKHALPLQNVDSEGRLTVVEDMVDLPFLHEVS